MSFRAALDSLNAMFQGYFILLNFVIIIQPTGPQLPCDQKFEPSV